MPMDSALPAWVRDAARHPRLPTYGAWDGDSLVATAGLSPRTGSAPSPARRPFPEFGARGAQGALMTRRIADAAAAGSEWITAETGAETPEEPNPSLHNMRRIGLVELYERRNWLWLPRPD